MADSSNIQPRALAPRRLDHRESLQSLNLWKSAFRNYYRRCQYYGIFLLPETTWNNDANRGFTAEQSGLKRSAQTLAADLSGFLDCIGSYLPYDYVSEKLQAETTCIQSVWDLIYELYDAEISTSNFLDYATMEKHPDETYRAYYNRLVGFMRQHLPKTEFHVEGITAPRTGEQLTVALLDSVAIHWLLQIDKRLVSIVKTEFSTDLKTKRLSQLVKQISQNIDDLLARYDTKDQVSLIQAKVSDTSNRGESSDIAAIVRRIERLESRPRPFNKKKRNFKQSRPIRCSHCVFLNKQLGATLDTNHHSAECGKKSVSISLLESQGTADSSQVSSTSTSEYPEGDNKNTDIPNNLDLQMNDGGPIVTRNSAGGVDNSYSNITANAVDNTCVNFIDNIPAVSEHRAHGEEKFNAHTVAADTRFYDKSQSCAQTDFMVKNSLVNQPCSGINEINLSDTEPCFSATLNALQTSQFPWNSIEKSTSPRIKCRLKNQVFSALIDSGAEINALDRDFALSLGINIKKSVETARSANKLPLDVFGQTCEPVEVECLLESGSIMLQLGIMLVIVNLGAQCLLGEPAKLRNNLICLPRHKMVVIAKGAEVQYVPYEQDKPKYSLIRATSSAELKPGEQIKYKLPDFISLETSVAITPRLQSSHWLTPTMQQPKDRSIFLTNSSCESVLIKKDDHLAEVRNSTTVDMPIKPLPGKAIHPDVFQFSDFSSSRQIEPDYIEQIKVDPDNVLSMEQRSIFHKLHR